MKYQMKSILVDFYNLELDLSNITEANWRTPEADIKKILEFFGRHAPEVLRYQTAAEIEALPKPIKADKFVGTLGAYEKFKGVSWFDNGDANQFYWDYLRIHSVTKDYITQRKIPKGHLLILVKDFSQDVTPSVFIGDNETKEAISLSYFPEEQIDLAKYTILRGQRISARWDLATSKVVSGLYEELIRLLEGKFEIRKCGAVNCGKIFIPSTDRKKEVYHDKKCYWRETKRRYRSRKK